jgi:hypothetical protein
MSVFVLCFFPTTYRILKKKIPETPPPSKEVIIPIKWNEWSEYRAMAIDPHVKNVLLTL